MNYSKERHIAKVIALFVAVIGAALLLVDLATTAKWLPERYSIILKGVAVLTAIAVAWFSTENIVQSVLQWTPFLAPKPTLSTGPWNIRITFDDNDGNGLKERDGQITIRRSLLGVRVLGGELRNPAKNTLTMNLWFAIDADLITYAKHDIIYYLYKIPIVRGGKVVDGDKYEKVGFVFARRNQGEAVFTGEFVDIQVSTDSGGRQRTGKVSLWQTRYA